MRVRAHVGAHLPNIRETAAGFIALLSRSWQQPLHDAHCRSEPSVCLPVRSLAEKYLANEPNLVVLRAAGLICSFRRRLRGCTFARPLLSWHTTAGRKRPLSVVDSGCVCLVNRN